MNIYVLNKEFQKIDIVEHYASFIWTIRYLEAGDFEMVINDQNALANLQIGNYILCDAFYKDDIAPLMIIESIEIEKNDTSDDIRISGRDLKSILDRRIVWGSTIFNSGDLLKNVITKIFDDNIKNPPDWEKEYIHSDQQTVKIKIEGAYRRIDNFVIDNRSLSLDSILIDEEKQYNGETVYDVFCDLLSYFYLGFDVLYNFEKNQMFFTVLELTDRTTKQFIKEPLIFSSNLDNFKNGRYIYSQTNEKNTALLIGEKYEESDQYNVMYNILEFQVSGLDRRETSIDVSSVSRINEETQKEYGNLEYLSMLKDKGIEELNKMKQVIKYDGVVNETSGYEYLKDYSIGDICEIYDDYGNSNFVYIEEVVMSVSTNGYTIIPTFSTLDNED